ncbi:unnamed protein product [Adineta ricciae]|uniref:Uncharacterized protein n=1 Tax=Adineta ricciae TaxID=249248 RepID=A0A815NSK2_ADIRI|nr:unnamed protein product [Adineta ricciae]CAF1433601.1 unnamed protein product [Adineta ricciae]
MTELNSIPIIADVANEFKILNTLSGKIDSSTDDVRSQNREQLIEKLQRVIQEKNASIQKLEEREQVLTDTLKKRNVEFQSLEDRLKQFSEKTRTFEQLHQLQVQTFEKTVHDFQSENERLYEQIRDLTKQLSEKVTVNAIHQEKIQTFDRIIEDVQLWRQKLDSYKAIIEEREQTITNLKSEINDLNKKKQTNGVFEENSLKLQMINLENIIRDRDNEIEHLKVTLYRVRDTLQPGHHLSHESRWQSCHENIGRNTSLSRSSRRKISTSPSTHSSSLDTDELQKKFQALTDRFHNLQKELVNRDDHIVTLKKVHDKRWLRLKHLQKQYRSLKDELQSYTDDEILQNNTKQDYSYRRAIRKTRNICSVCNDQQWKKTNGVKRNALKQEDDDQVWNEISKYKRESARITNENLSLQEKLDLQEVEINEQIIVIDELRNEIQRLKDENNQPSPPPPVIKSENIKQIHELDRKLYELENERTCLLFEQERLKTEYNLCLDEKQHLLQQKNQLSNELKKAKLRILSLQDQVYKLKRESNEKKFNNSSSTSTINRRVIKKKPKKSMMSKTCLELLLDQNSTLIDEQLNQSLMSNRPRQRRSCSLCNHQKDKLLPRKRYGRNILPKITRKTSTPVSVDQSSTIRIASLRKQVEELQSSLTNSHEENDHLNQRLTMTLSRINILKTTNQKLTDECNKLKVNQSVSVNHDSISNDSAENLHERLRNTSYDATQQRKLNKTLQTENELLTKTVQSITEKLTHAERDVASKRLLIETYKNRINELEASLTRANEKNTSNNDEEKLKALNDTIDKLKASIDSYKTRLQAITREKHELDSRHTQLIDEHQKLKTRSDDLQTKYRLIDQQLRQVRLHNEQLNEELSTSRRISEQQLLTLNTKSQDSLKKITSELDQTLQRSNEYEKFIRDLLNDLIQRNVQMNENLKKARDFQKQRESLSMTLPGFDSAMNTASKILNLTQDDLDEIMSATDESFQGTWKEENLNKNDKLQHKLSKLFVSREDVSAKLLKLFSKTFDELQTTNRELAIVRSY